MEDKSIYTYPPEGNLQPVLFHFFHALEKYLMSQEIFMILDEAKDENRICITQPQVLKLEKNKLEC